MGLPLSATAAAIRRAVPSDAQRLGAIAHAAKRRWGYSDEMMRLWAPDLTITPAAIAEQLVYCAVRDGAILGWYALVRDEEDTELEHMWVEPELMGRGVGRSLFRHALATARQSGGTLLRIASDPNAEGFYLRMGATRVGEQPSLPEGRMLPLLVVSLRDASESKAAGQ